MMPWLRTPGPAAIAAIAVAVALPTAATGTTYDFSPREVILLRDGTRLVAQDGWNSVAMYRVADGALLHRFPAEKRIRRMVLSPDESTLLVGTSDGTLHLWRVESGERLWEKPYRETGLRYAGDASFSGDGSRFAVCDERDRVVVFATLTGDRVGEVGFAPDLTNVMAVALNADGTGGFLVPLGGGLHRFEIASGRPVDIKLAATWPLRYSADHKYLAFSVSREPEAEQLAIISTGEDAVKRPLGKFGLIGNVRPLPDGSFLVTAVLGRSEDQTYAGSRIWPDGRIEQVWKLKPDGRVNHRTAFLPSPLIGVSTNFRLVTTVSDLQTGRMLLEIDNSANYRPEMMSTYSRGLLNMPEFYLGLGGVVIGLLLAFRIYRRVKIYKDLAPDGASGNPD